MATGEPTPDVAEHLHDVLAAAMHERGEMLVKYAAVVESIGQDGSTGMFLAASPDSTAWEIIGFLEYARDVERAAIVRDHLDDPG